MPFVRIDALRADQATLDGLGRAVHEALIDAIGIPADDLFQVLTSHDGTTGTFRYDRCARPGRCSGRPGPARPRIAPRR